MPHRAVCSADGLLVAVNCLAVVFLVIVMKLLYQNHFECPSAMTALHCLMTGMVGLVYKQRFMQPGDSIPSIGSIAALSALKMGSYVTSNLSLMFNSVNLFEVLRFTNIPLMCLVEYVWKRKTYSAAIYLSLAGICCGSSLSTITEVEFSWVGLGVGLACTVCTVAYQLYNNHLQTQQSIHPLLLLYFETPFTCACTLLGSWGLGEMPKLMNTTFEDKVLLLLFLSGLLAATINVTAYLIIGKMSALTYQVVGHLKTVCVLASGFLLFQQLVTPVNVIGTSIAVSSLWLYTTFKRRDAERAKEPLLSPEDDSKAPLSPVRMEAPGLEAKR
eukprot:EG_transcript_13314